MSQNRLKVGDVFEIATSQGLAYAQLAFVHRVPPKMGDLVRVLPSFYDSMPNLAELVEREERFVTFVPMGTMIRRGMAKFVANLPIPESKRALPLFRSFVGSPGDPGVWRRWDGNDDSFGESNLTEEHKNWPILATWSPELLVERIESGWSHLDEW